MAQSMTSKRLREAFADYNHPSNPRAMANSAMMEMASDNPDWAVITYALMWSAYLVAKHEGRLDWLSLDGGGIGGPLVDEMMETPNV